MTITRHLRISGRVQGVSFRHYMREEALRLGVRGWVRNRSDGSVEAMVHGSTESVDALVEWTRHGPRGARVADVKVTEDDAGDGAFEGFEIGRTE